MNTTNELDIFLVTLPGLESLLAAEAAEHGFENPTLEPGGVAVKGDWPAVWRANLQLRGASKVLVRLGAFRAMHLAQLDKRARKFPWDQVLRGDVPVRVEATCRKSRIYHGGAAKQRIARAIRDTLGVEVRDDAPVCIKVRIADDLCTISVDTSGEGLHKRGHKQAVNKAPLRETIAAMMLRHCGFDGSMPVLDPMCGSGTLVIEAAEIAANLMPGRSRGFAFEQLATFDDEPWDAMRAQAMAKTPSAAFLGFDQDVGAVRMSEENAQRAGVAAWTEFHCAPVDQLERPPGPPGLVVVNPPYGGRIGNAKALSGLYRTLGQRLKAHFQGWRVGLVTNDDGLARACGLPFEPPGPSVSHGGKRVNFHRSRVLGG